ncbi:MAG: hypothetical protein LBG19_05425 [Prevotellaceae bacterium]|jgi:hypothetical protein|nr:hypothetical protein [Prevotellaceae bacterium]
MKKQAVIFYAVLFSVAIGIGLSSCKGSPKTDESKGSGEAEGATVNLTLEIMASDILHELSDHSTDPMYLKAFAIATERQKADTTAHFIDLFGKAWEEQNPDARQPLFSAHTDFVIGFAPIRRTLKLSGCLPKNMKKP